MGENQLGSIKKITYSDGKVKIENSKNATCMQIALQKAGIVDSFGDSISENSENDTRFSYSDKYERKQAYVDKVMGENAKVESLTEEQHNALSKLASIRHEIHSNWDTIFSENESDEIGDFLFGDKINTLLESAGLPTIKYDLTDLVTESDYYEFENDDEWESIAEEEGYSNGFHAWKESGGYDDFANEMDKFNKTIENYLANIDEKHGTKYAPTGIARTRYSKNTDSHGNALTEKQDEYFKDSKVRDENGNLLVVYHGTVREFYTFDRQYSNIEGDMGKGFYFTNDIGDVSRNYANEDGADLTQKIELEAERLEGTDEYEDYDLEQIKDVLKNKYITSEPITIESYLCIKNPCYVDKTYLMSEYNDEYNIEDYDDEEDYYGDVDSLISYDVDKVLGELESQGYYGIEGVSSILFDAASDGGIKLSILKDKLNELDIEDEDGNLAGNEVARIIVEQLGYDGIIDNTVSEKFRNMGLGNSTTHYIAFNPNQIKSVNNINPTENDDIRYSIRDSKGNTNPTDNSDIRFSLKGNIEETKDLIAVHNLTQDKLIKSLKLGGLPMPSIAIAKAKEGHNSFGEISLVFSKDTIDPKLSRSNKVYSGDAWTPTYPQVDYKVSEKVQGSVYKKINELLTRDEQVALGGLHLDYDNLSNSVSRADGNMDDYFKNDYAMKYAYIKDKGIDIELPSTQKELDGFGEFGNDFIKSVANRYGKEKVMQLHDGGYSEFEKNTQIVSDLMNMANNHFVSTLADEGLAKMMREKPLYNESNFGFSKYTMILEAAFKYFNNGITEQIDYSKAKPIIDNSVDKTDYSKWLSGLFNGIVEKTGIRNEKDTFTASGSRRSFEALHYEETLENIVKAMKEKGEQGIGGFGGGNIFGASAVAFGSVDEIKANESKIQRLSEDDFESIKKGFRDRLFELVSGLPKNSSFSAIDDAANMLCEAVTKCKTKSGMANYIRKESEGWANYSDYIVDDLIELVNDIRNMPTEYFEAKPQRAVGFDEVKAVLVPSNISDTLDNLLVNNGLNVVKYEQGNDADRVEKLNSLEEVRFSKRTIYDEFNSLAMQWSKSADTNVGDLCIFAHKANDFSLLEATDGGYVELARGKYKKVRNIYEQTYGATADRLYEYSQSFESRERNDNWDMLNVGDRGYGNRNGGEIESGRLQTDTERNGADLLSGDKGTPFRNSLKDVSQTDDYLLEENKQLKAAVETLKAEMKLSEKHNLNQNRIEIFAKRLLRKTGSIYDIETLKENLTRVFDYMANDENANYDDVIGAMKDMLLLLRAL